jgi:hypothetical protein
MRPFQLGDFDYDECFLGVGGFLSPEANEEKHMMSFYLEELAAELARQGVVFGGAQPLHWLEPGIGDGSSTARFAGTLGRSHPAGFVIHGSDCQSEMLPLARRAIENVQAVPMAIAELSVVDAFSGEPLASRLCDFALLSHFVYHAKNLMNGRQPTEAEIDQRIGRLIGSLTESLHADGIALAFHESSASDMFGKLGREYGSAMYDATRRIAAAARSIGKHLVAMPLESKLYFPDLSSRTIEDFKDLVRWREFGDGTPEASWLKKFLFALHSFAEIDESGGTLRAGGARHLAGQSSQRSSGSRLCDAIDRLCEILQRDERGPYLVIRSEMQALLNGSHMKEPVDAAFSAVTRQLPAIHDRTSLALDAAARKSATE